MMSKFKEPTPTDFDKLPLLRQAQDTVWGRYANSTGLPRGDGGMQNSEFFLLRHCA